LTTCIQEGEPRYASKEWVERLGAVAALSGGKMSLAAHLCGARVNEVLDGNDTFVSSLSSLGYRRVQVNATAVNGVDTSNLKESVSNLVSLMEKYNESLEFIIQKNEETKPLWESLMKHYNYIFPPNVTMLVDESKGTGVLASSWPSPTKQYNIGYAGGIGPKNIRSVLEQILQVTSNSHFWIDMESSLRSQKNNMDVFDLDKCYECIEAVCEMKIKQHPPFLQQAKENV
jgi:phosphoribosylanthranilate isomerase